MANNEQDKRPRAPKKANTDTVSFRVVASLQRGANDAVPVRDSERADGGLAESASSQADDAEGLASLDAGVGDCIYTRSCRGCRGRDYAAVERRTGFACGARVGDGGSDGAHLLNTAGEDSIFP